MIRNIFVSLFLIIALTDLSRAIYAGELTQFPTEQAAQKHCPHDTVVWLNTATGVYHFKGQRWYGATKRGAFVCQQEAGADGDRATRNGQ